MRQRRTIGVFDSGLGGLSVLKEIREQVLNTDILYVADQAHVPYGTRSENQIRQFSEGITRYLLDQGAKLIVVACNTASAVALNTLRQVYSPIPFVGMEPAVKPAVEKTSSGIVGVLATQTTFQGELYASVVERFASGVKILTDSCPGLVSQIEKGALNASKTREILEQALDPMLEQGIDTVVLGCTHYPFVIPTIQDIVGPGVRVINPAPSVARQVQRLLDEGDPGGQMRNISEVMHIQQNQIRIETSGDAVKMQTILPIILGQDYPVSQVMWQGNTLRQ